MPNSPERSLAPLVPGLDIDPARLDGVLWRRPFAYIVDVAILAGIYTLAAVIGSFFFLVSFGLLLGPLALVWALIPVAYHSLLIGGRHSATWGQRLFDIEVRRIDDGSRPSLLQAVVQTVLFYVTVAFTSFLILLVALFNRNRRTVHDFLAGTVTLRRAPREELLLPREAR